MSDYWQATAVYLIQAITRHRDHHHATGLQHHDADEELWTALHYAKNRHTP